ncbi:MAG: DUF971 domain-containing protein [Chloroflexota bacterium]|nr:DUF971 domain-containing protein [Chloroflexota bacterium]
MSHDLGYIEPLEIELKRDLGQMQVKWSDGHEGHSTFVTLRWNCPCASCRGEMGVPGRLDFVKKLGPDEIEMESLEAVGLYALRPIWKDGHETGFYTHEHLRELCECEQCMAERPTKFHHHRLVTNQHH